MFETPFHSLSQEVLTVHYHMCACMQRSPPSIGLGRCRPPICEHEGPLPAHHFCVKASCRWPACGYWQHLWQECMEPLLTRSCLLLSCPLSPLSQIFMLILYFLSGWVLLWFQHLFEMPCLLFHLADARVSL